MAGRGNNQPPPNGVWTTNVVAPQGMTMTHLTPPQKDYTGRAWFAIICCCWILGICAMMKMAESRKSYRIGDTATARDQEDQARMMSNIGIIIGIASFIVLFVVVVVLNILE